MSCLVHRRPLPALVGCYMKSHNQLGWIWKKVTENTVKHLSSSIYVFLSVPPSPLKPVDLQLPPPLSKKPPDRHVATGIRHATTIFHWHKGNCYISKSNHLCISLNGIQEGSLLFIGGVNMHGKLFIRMRTPGRILQRWRRLM